MVDLAVSTDSTTPPVWSSAGGFFPPSDFEPLLPSFEDLLSSFLSLLESALLAFSSAARTLTVGCASRCWRRELAPAPSATTATARISPAVLILVSIMVLRDRKSVV